MAVYAGPDIVEDGLVLCLDAANPRSYPGTGTTWFDISGRENHFTLYNSPSFTNNKFIFDGVNDYARSTNTIDFSNTASITVEFSFKPITYVTGSGSGKLLFELTNNFNNYSTGFNTSYNDVGNGPWPYDIGVGVKGENGYSVNAWNKNLYSASMPIVTVPIFDKTISSGAEVNLYINGEQKSPETYVEAWLKSNNTNNFANDYFYISGRAGTSFFPDMELYSVKIYNRVLRPAEILQNFNAFRGRFNI